MSNSAQPILRFPFILLAAVDLVLLSMRIGPWQDVLNLPGNGATAIDPAVTLLGYIGLIFWMTGNHSGPVQKALSSATLLGLLAGFLLAALVMLGGHPAADATQPSLVQWCVWGAAAVLWGIAGLRGASIAQGAGIGIFSSVWSAMVSCLMACTALLAQLYLVAAPPPVTLDPWKQYEGLAIGNPATQALVHSLNSAEGYLLIGPLVGCAVGVLFGFFAQSKEG